MAYYLFLAKKRVNISEQGASNTPDVISVLGWRRWVPILINPCLGSDAPYTKMPNCAHRSAAAHITHGSSVTYRVPSGRYFPPRACVAEVIACISAWAVGSCSVSVRLCARAMMRFWHTTMAPMGTSPLSCALCASFSASCIKAICV